MNNQEAYVRTKIPVYLKKVHKNAIIPKYAEEGDSGFDFHSVKDYEIQPGETVVVNTGIKVSIPSGFEIQIRPRSGISYHTGLRVANSPGTIDSGYRGEIGIIFYNVGSTVEKIEKGDRVAQGVLKNVPKASFQVAQELPESSRGAGGFGSTGKK